MPTSETLTNEEKIRLALDSWFVTGATASGKTAASVKLARTLNAEIISMDSMAIYRGMDIGTAKVRPEIREQIPHHLIDCISPTATFSVNQYRDAAIQAIQEIRGRGREVVFVGGTALYLKAMLRGIFEGPPANPEFREMIEKELESVEVQELHKRLELVDPVSAHKLHPNDKRRIIRALEVYRETGEPISHLQEEFETAHSPEDCKVFTLRHPRHVLHARIQNRVDWMFEQGLVDEVQGLLDKHGALSNTASQAVGYREVIGYLNKEYDLERTRELVLFRTRQFARHQETWFRGLPECQMIDLPEGTADEDIPDRVVEAALENS